MERFQGVRGKKNVEATIRALQDSGATILSAPPPNVAPFEFRARTPDGETIDLVCYAFTANKYGQRGRPADEHRFQVKYGSKFHDYHYLYLDPERRRTTLMYGVHHKLRLFIAVDPAMHSPTWLSRSVEFKEKNLKIALRDGWHAWERERKSVRRKQRMPKENLETESLVAFRPEYFLQYVAFERVTSGIDTGERLLLAEKIGHQIRAGAKPTLPDAHPLEKQLDLSAAQILDVLGGSFRLLVAVRGSVAEHHLETQLRKTPGITDVHRLDIDKQPDFKVTYRGRSFLIECKNVLRHVRADRIPRVDFQKTRAAIDNPCNRYYERNEFDVLAACLHPITEKWEYRFSSTRDLPEHSKCPGRISQHVAVAGDNWTTSLVQVLDQLRST